MSHMYIQCGFIISTVSSVSNIFQNPFSCRNLVLNRDLTVLLGAGICDISGVIQLSRLENVLKTLYYVTKIVYVDSITFSRLSITLQNF